MIFVKNDLQSHPPALLVVHLANPRLPYAIVCVFHHRLSVLSFFCFVCFVTRCFFHLIHPLCPDHNCGHLLMDNPQLRILRCKKSNSPCKLVHVMTTTFLYGGYIENTVAKMWSQTGRLAQGNKENSAWATYNKCCYIKILTNLESRSGLGRENNGPLRAIAYYNPSIFWHCMGSSSVNSVLMSCVVLNYYLIFLVHICNVVPT